MPWLRGNGEHRESVSRRIRLDPFPFGSASPESEVCRGELDSDIDCGPVLMFAETRLSCDPVNRSSSRLGHHNVRRIAGLIHPLEEDAPLFFLFSQAKSNL